MEQIEIILRITDLTGKVTEQLLAKFDTENPVIERDEVLQYSIWFLTRGTHFLLQRLMNFRLLFILPVSQGEYSRKSRSIRQSGRRSLWM